MVERNACKEAGCHASCCRGAYFSRPYSTKKVREWFPNAIKVRHGELSEIKIDGVCYSSFLGAAMVRIVGTCPNLDSNDNCKIYDSKPPDCENLTFSSKNCAEFRRKHEGPILSEFQQEIATSVNPQGPKPNP